MRAFASFINFVVMMCQIVTRQQQREWGLLKKKNHVTPKRDDALPQGHLSMDAEEDAWAEQRVRESGFIDKAIELAKALADGAAQIELDIETGIPIHSHEIPMEVPGLVGSFNMRNTTFVAHVDGQDVTDVSGEIDEMYEHEGEESTEKSGGESMYKQNNITMLPIIEAELGSTSVVSAIMSFFIGMRDRVYAAVGGDTSMGIGGVCGGGVDEGDGGSAGGEVDPGGETDSEGDEEIGWNIMRYLVTHTHTHTHTVSFTYKHTHTHKHNTMPYIASSPLCLLRVFTSCLNFGS